MSLVSVSSSSVSSGWVGGGLGSSAPFDSICEMQYDISALVNVCLMWLCEHAHLVVFLQEVLVLLLNHQLLKGLGGLGQRCTLGTSQGPMARQLVDRADATGHAPLCCNQGRLAVHGD